MIRQEAVAGQFYAADADKLNKQIKNCFDGKFGPEKLQGKKEKIYGVIAPHAGYEYSGQCASWAYKAIAEMQAKASSDLYIIIGVNHRGIGKNIALSLADFSTPFGIVKNDNDFCKNLEKKLLKANLNCSIDENAHKYEHSIEVQLPFLLYSLKNKKIRFVPILVSGCDEECYKAIASAIVQTSKPLNKKICIIASSDFTHYGFSYGFAPFPPSKEDLYKLDNKAINKIIKFDANGFLKQAEKTTICGKEAIAVCIEACKLLGSKKAELLKYYTSGDIIGDCSNAVGYAAIAFE